MQFCDLFSGIGGISLALKNHVETVLYCEKDKFCQNVLLARQNDGSIDQAPIHTDICNLHLGSGIQPTIIGGGFPCQDISTAGVQKGIIGGDRSSLFYEIMRLVDENQCIKYIFLENVSNILKCGMKEVVDELSKRNFDFQWTMKSAGSMGAPHVRNRWFLLGSRYGPNGELPRKTFASGLMWENEPLERVSFKPNSGIEDESFDTNWIQRCQALGNTVVPCVVENAFVELWNGLLYSDKIVECLGQYSISMSEMKYPYPEAGIVCNGQFIGLPQKNIKISSPQVSISICQGNMIKYPTPRRGTTHASTSLSDRSLHDLPTILINSDESKKYVKTLYGKNPDKLTSIVTPNVNYIEWMMGYAPNWTRIVNQELPKKFSKIEINVPKCRKQNGMHIFMKDNPGKDVKTIAGMWRALSSDVKATYSAQIKSI